MSRTTRLTKHEGKGSENGTATQGLSSLRPSNLLAGVLMFFASSCVGLGSYIIMGESRDRAKIF